MLHIQTILHATDFSAQSDWAFQLACALARDYGARLVVLHVKAPPQLGAAGEFGYVLPPDPAEEEAAVRHQLAALQPADPGIPVERRLGEGDPVTAIVDFAEERNCDLIVLGTHGRRGLGRLFMGSVAEGVLRQAPCPVLTVKAPVPGAAAPKEDHAMAGTA